MRPDFLQVDNRRLNVTRVDFCAVAILWEVTLGAREALQELGFNRISEQLFGDLNHAPGILNHLHSLDAGKLIEEPAATGVHEHGVALEFHQLPHQNLLRLVQIAHEMLSAKAFAHFGRAIEDNRYIAIARGPWVP